MQSFESDLKSRVQCGKAAGKANQILGLININFINKNNIIILKLYKFLVRPRLDYCIQVWNPHLCKEITQLEAVQKRATKMISKFKDLSYIERLKETHLTTLQTRRIRADAIQVFKIIIGQDAINFKNFFVLNNNNNRGHTFKLLKLRFNKDIGKFNFRNRVCNFWNSLPDTVIDSSSLNIFKNKIDEYLRIVKGLR